MKIIVGQHKIEIAKEPVNEREIDITKCEFEFDEAITSEYVKEAYFTLEDNTYKQIIVNNECDIPSEVLVKKGTVEIGVVAFLVENEEEIKRYNPSPAYFNTWVGSLKDNAENSKPITPSDKEQMEQALQDGLNSIDDKLGEVDDKMLVVDSKIEDIDTAITQTNNLNIDVSDKVGKDVTVTLTKKDATTKVVTLSDGISLMFNWSGTSLGIKTDEDEEYTYVDLQGIQGIPGPQGEPFRIKKTYSSVAEMNADFNNMEYGDYVMIASSVEVEDNAKLYTRGESQWIFITDFSGATGIRGETGLTPSIQIGTVVSGATPSVTRTGTDENPVLNFVLQKGDKGDKGETGATGPKGDKGDSGASEWGDIGGTLSNQTDLQNALDSKADASNIPTKTSDLTNDSGFITSSSLANINGFLLNGINPTKIKDFLTMMRAMLITEGEYGVEWDLFATNNSSSCTKLYDNVGLSITPGTDSTAEVNNYPKIFKSIDCNYININGEDIITALKGMSNYGETPSEIQDVTIDGVTYTPDVGTVHFSRYEKYGINSSGKMEYSMSWIPRDGYTLIDLGKDKNGNFKPYFIIAKYVAGYDSNNKVRSAAGLDPACHLTGSSAGDENADHNMNYTNCITIFHTRGNYYSAALMSEYGFIMRDFWLKFATRNTQSIMAGNTSNNYQYAVATAETGVHRVVLTNAQAANIDLLSCVSVGDRGTATNNDRINKYLHNICKCARVIAKETVDTDHTALILDHANFNTTSTTYVSTMHERSGYSKFVRGRYGSPINNTNGKHGMVFNGIEIAVGGYEVAGNAILDIIDNTGKREVYVTNNATKLSGTVATIKDTYTKSSLSIQPTTSNAWNYITRYDYDLTNGLMVPTEAGQSGSGTSTGFADGLYVDNAASGQRECLWLGSLNDNGRAGLSCLATSGGLSYGDWNILARLSTNGVRG